MSERYAAESTAVIEENEVLFDDLDLGGSDGIEVDEDEYDLDACRQLYMSIIELAVQDFRFLERMRGQRKTSRYDRKKLRQMTEDGDPHDFFRSAWFEEVCDYIGVQPNLIRERLRSESSDADELLGALVA